MEFVSKLNFFVSVVGLTRVGNSWAKNKRNREEFNRFNDIQWKVLSELRHLCINSFQALASMVKNYWMTDTLFYVCIQFLSVFLDKHSIDWILFWLIHSERNQFIPSAAKTTISDVRSSRTALGLNGHNYWGLVIIRTISLKQKQNETQL